MKKQILAAIFVLTGPFLATSALADSPVVQNVSMKKSGDTWTFDVTISHKDTGWEDFANSWRVVDGAGTVLGVRDLSHPHVDEQPFTRSLSGVSIPEGVTEVGIQVSDSVGGWSSSVKTINLR